MGTSNGVDPPMETMQQQARALGDPTRHAMFRYVAEASEPVGVAELTEHFGFNHNAIRQHLAKLVDAGLVTETKAPAGAPGRRRHLYAVHPSADSRWGVAGPYERLSLLLTEIIRSGDSPQEVGRREGRRLRATAGTGDAVQQLHAAMAGQGFDPEVLGGGDAPDVVLHRCPFASTALADPATVCQLHLGLAEGLVDDHAAVAVDELVANDPREANCRLTLRTADRAESSPRLQLRRD